MLVRLKSLIILFVRTEVEELTEHVMSAQKNTKPTAVYNNITTLQTPVGFFEITSDNNNEKYPFSVELNTFNIPWKVNCSGKADQREVEEIVTEHNYTIKVDKSDLKKGETYIIKFSRGNWEYCDGGEHTSCYTVLINKWLIGIGGYDPNDEKRIQWVLRKPAGKEDALFSDIDFENYNLSWNKEKNGFEFTLIDNVKKFIYFDVAWIKVESYNLVEYKDALSFWIT